MLNFFSGKPIVEINTECISFQRIRVIVRMGILEPCLSGSIYFNTVQLMELVGEFMYG